MLDAIQQHAFLYVVKRYLGNLVKSELHLGRVGVRLGCGDLELKDVLLNCDYLNTHLEFTGLEVTAGYVSQIHVQIDWNTLAARVGIDGVLLTVQPRGTPGQQSASSHKKEGAVESAEDNAFFGQQIFSELVSTICSRIKVTFVNWTIKLEDGCGSNQNVVIHGKRVALGSFEESEVDNDDGDEYMFEREDVSFSVILEGISLEVDTNCESEGEGDTEAVQLLSLDGGRMHLISVQTLIGVSKQLFITLGSVGASIESSSVDSLGEAVRIIREITERCIASLSQEKARIGEDNAGSKMFDELGTEVEEDEDEFLDCHSKLGSSIYSSREDLNSVGVPSTSAGGHCSLQVQCRIPVVSVTLGYVGMDGESREEAGGLDLFLEDISASGVFQEGKEAAWNGSVSSVLCFECMSLGQACMSPEQAQSHVAGLRNLPSELRRFVRHGAQKAVIADNSTSVLPLFQIGLRDDGNDKKQPCLIVQTSSMKDSIGSLQRQVPRRIEIKTQQLAVWTSCSSLKRILAVIDNLGEGLGRKLKMPSKLTDSRSLNSHVQSVIDDIDSRVSGRGPNQTGQNLEISWQLPGMMFVLEKCREFGKCSGLIFACMKCEQSANRAETPFLSFEKKMHGLKSMWGGLSTRENIESVQIRIADVHLYNINWARDSGRGDCSCIVKIEEEKKHLHNTDSNLLDFDTMENHSAISIDIRVKPDALGHMAAGDADAFMDWHSADRWADCDGCWHEEGSYTEVAFQAQCVDTAKVFVRAHLSTIKVRLSEEDIEDVVNVVGGVSPDAKKEKNVENVDQVTVLLSGSLDCALRPASSRDKTAEASASRPSQSYHFLVDDLGFLKTSGISGGSISAQWAWCRGIKLTGGKLNTCFVYAPGPVDSQLPNPPGIEFARVVKPGQVSGKSAGEVVSLRLKGITVATDIDDLEFSLLMGLGRYAPQRTSSQAEKQKEVLFAVNAEKIGLRCEPGKDWKSTAECPAVAGVVFVEGVHCVGSSLVNSHQVVSHSLSVHLADNEKRNPQLKGVEKPVDLQSIQLQEQGFCCVSQEGGLKVEVTFVQSNPEMGIAGAKVDIKVTNQQFMGIFSHKSLGLVMLFMRQIQGILPGPPLNEVEVGDADGLETGNIFDELDEDTFRQPPVFNSAMASECAAGQWFEDADGMSDIMDGWISEIPTFGHRPSQPAEPSEPVATQGTEEGGWFDGEAPKVIDDYVQVPTPSESQVISGPEWSSCLQISEDRLEPVLTLILDNISIMWVLIDDSAGKEGRLELDVCGLNLRFDNFQENKEYVRHIAVQVQEIELRDCRSPTSNEVGWQHILSRYRPRSQKFLEEMIPSLTAPMVELILDSVHPERDNSQEELRMKLEIVPLRLKVDQAVVDFLMSFVNSLPSASEPDQEMRPEEVPFIQLCEVAPVNVVVDYLPRKFNIVALRAGNAAEALNFIRWGGVKLHLRGLKLAGLLGWDTLIKALAAEWQKDVVGKQVHKFLKGIPAVRSAVRISSAAKVVVKNSIESFSSRSQHDTRHARSPATRQLQRSSLTLLRVLAVEALNAGASVTAGAEMVLQGSVDTIPRPPAGSHSGNVMPGLRQTGASVRAAFNNIMAEPMNSFKNGEGLGTVIVKTMRAAPAVVVAPASAAASALRCTIEGCRNTLDVDKILED